MTTTPMTTTPMTTIPKATTPLAWLLIGLVRVYQLVVSPWIPQSCRFYPSCSAYAVTALRRHGAVRGAWLAARRLGRCHPWNPGGVDHVPASRARPGHVDCVPSNSSPSAPAEGTATAGPSTAA
jgi:uncharacterized protein